MSIMEDQTKFKVINGILVSYKGDNVVVIPEGVEEVNEKSFAARRNEIQEVYFPKSLKIIGPKTFMACKMLNKVMLNEGIEEIGEQAFAGCASLMALTIPKGIGKIADFAFSESLRILFVMGLKRRPLGWGRKFAYYRGGHNKYAYYFNDNLNIYWNPKAEYNNWQNEGCLRVEELYVTGTSHEEEVIVPEGIKIIGKKAFYKNNELKKITLPDSLETIGQEAFAWCENLQEVRFAKSLQLIEKNAFEHCESLVGVDLPDSITEIGPESFYCCEGLRKVKLPNGLKVIPSSAFAFCSNIFELKLPEELEIIEANAFGWALEHVDMINFPPKLKQICSGAFEKAADFKTSLKSVTFPPTLERIEHRAFYMNEKLVEAKLLENVKYVASDAFEGCLIGPLDANWESEADQQNKYSISVRQHTFLSGMFCLPTERIDTLVMEDGIVGIPYAYFGESKSPSLFSNGLTQDYGSGVKSIVDKLVLPSSFLDAIPKNRFDTIFLPYPWMRTLDTPENVFGLDWITLTEVEFIHVNSRAYYLPYPLVSRAFISSKPQKNSLSQKAYVDYAKIALDSAMPLPNKAILSIVIAIFHDNLELVDSRPFINFLETHKELLKSQEIQEYCTRHDFSKLYTDLIENQLDYKEPDSKYSEVLKMRKQWDAECALQGEKTVGIQIDIKLKATNKVIENILILIQDVFGLFILFYKNNFFDLISVNKLTTQEIVNNEQTEITIVVRSGLDYLDREINTPFFSHVEFINKLFPEAKMVGCFRINAREYLPFVSNHAGEISAGELQYSFGSDWVFEDSAPPEPVWWNFDDASPDDATVKEYKYYKKIFNKENLFCLNNGNLNRENINYKKGKDGITKLMRASQTGDLTSMKTIIEDGADINNVVSAEGYTALEYAIYAKKYEAIELLLQAGAKLEKKATRWGVTPLMRAANFKLLEIVRLLISGGADIEAVDRDGRTVLLYAIITNSYDIVDLLIREGVNIHTRDRDGKSPLIVAVNGYGDIRIVQLLLDNGGGIELNYDHESGGLALHHAVLNGRIDMVKLLLENGADPTAVKSYTPKGLNAIELAIAKEIKNKDEILGLLMDRHIKE